MPGDLVVDPAAGSFVVMHAAHALGREFIGCDLAFPESEELDADFGTERSRPAAINLSHRESV